MGWSRVAKHYRGGLHTTLSSRHVVMSSWLPPVHIPGSIVESLFYGLTSWPFWWGCLWLDCGNWIRCAAGNSQKGPCSGSPQWRTPLSPPSADLWVLGFRRPSRSNHAKEKIDPSRYLLTPASPILWSSSHIPKPVQTQPTISWLVNATLNWFGGDPQVSALFEKQSSWWTSRSCAFHAQHDWTCAY